MVIDDLRALPDSPLIVAEGTPIPARAVSEGIIEPSRTVWLIPTREFQQSMLARRALEPGRAAPRRVVSATIEQEPGSMGCRR
jgi:hypothetical protein